MKISRRSLLKTLGGFAGSCLIPRLSHAAIMPQLGSKMRMSSSPHVQGILADFYANLNLYWGDIHGHTGFSDGYGLPDEYFGHARNTNLLDFAAISDHAEWLNVVSERIRMNDGSPLPLWQMIVDSANAHNETGTFVTLIGWEWTSATHGHRNVYFRDSLNIPAAPMDIFTHPTPTELWADLESYSCLTIPHHPIRNQHYVDWNYSHEMERLVEIYSKWGNGETWACRYEEMAYYRLFPQARYFAKSHDVLSALKRGLRLGIVAGSDSHQGLPGSTFWAPPRGISINRDVEFLLGLSGEEFLAWLAAGNTFDHRQNMYGGGVFGAWADELKRENIWDAMYGRRVFGTTGIRPTIRFAVVDESTGQSALMGEDVVIGPGFPTILFYVEADPGTGIEVIDFFRNSELAHRHIYSGENQVAGFLRDENAVVGETYMYMMRIRFKQTANVDGDYLCSVNPSPHVTDTPQLVELAWTSPIWATRA